MKRQYFKNLNGVRFILAFAVIIHHIEEMASVLKINHHLSDYRFLHPIGVVSVSFFFTLSGFLITHILLVEKENTKTINLKGFYKSRLLRIWPLYFIILFTTWFVIDLTVLKNINDTFYFSNLFGQPEPIYLGKSVYFLLSLFLLPQLAQALSITFQGSLVYASQLWSIGVEEIFYLFWPFILLKFSNIKKSTFFIFFIYYLLVVLTIIIGKKMGHFDIGNIQVAKLAKSSILFLGFTRIPCLMIGVIAAILHHSKHKSLAFFSNKWMFLIALTLILLMLGFGIEFPFIIHEVYCTLFLFILFYLIKDNKSYFLENKMLNYLGKISYGIYMYHMIAIMIAFYLYQQRYLNYFTVYLSTIILTILFSVISYEFIEKKFLNLKR